MTRTERARRIATAFVAGSAACVISLGFASTAHAADAVAMNASIIAQDNTPPPAAPSSSVTVGVAANVVGGLTITGARGKPVTVSAQGLKPLTVKSSKTAPVVIRGLVPGTAYNVAIGGVRIGTATPLAAPGATYGLTVSTTSTNGQVQLTWKQQAALAQGALTFDVSATPVNPAVPAFTSRSASAAPLTVRSQLTAATLAGLDPNTLYTFTVIPRNTAAIGAGSSATMDQTLAALTGSAPVTSAAAVVPAPEPAAAQVSASAATPAAPPAPTTRTIYVCPDGYVDAGTNCTDTKAYTYSLLAYTYHQEPYSVTVQDPPTVYAADKAMSTGTLCPWGGSSNAGGDLCAIPGGTHSETRYNTVKDSAPAGYTDTGSQWSKKDAAPTGYLDNDSAWVKTVAKEARNVPA